MAVIVPCSCNKPIAEPEYFDQPATITRDAEDSVPEPAPVSVPTPTPRISGFIKASDNSPKSLKSPEIIIKKSERILELWDGDTMFGYCSIGLGWQPEGTKKVEGDGKTPEGEYYVCVRNDKSKYYLSLGVSYPNKDDAALALEEGTIDKATYDQIIKANNNKTRPPQTTAMGGQIMIHGHGGNRDWTAGCPAVDDEVMDILWKYCPNKTPIIILP